MCWGYRCRRWRETRSLSRVSCFVAALSDEIDRNIDRTELLPNLFGPALGALANASLYFRIEQHARHQVGHDRLRVGLAIGGIIEGSIHIVIFP